MAHSLSRPDPNTTPAGDFFHKPSATYYSISAHNGSFYQRRWQIGYQGKEENVEDLRIDYVMGSGSRVRTYLHRTARGTLIELPLAWYSEKGGHFGMNPGYDTPAPDTRRKIGYDCMFCHNSYPEIPSGHDAADAEPVFGERLPEGIDCQRCHGPGSEHVALARKSGATKDAIRTAILNPARLSPDRQMEVCMQCHLETTSGRLPGQIKRLDRPPFSYRADEPLSRFMLYFDHAPGTGREGKFEIVSSAYRLRQSRCFLASGGKLTCVRCHNPHAATNYTKVCRECHQQTAAAQHPAGDDCIGCHMPQRRTEDVVHAVMTDHLIQRKPAPDLLAERPEKNETDATAYHGAVAPYYDRDPLYTAVAQVSQKSNLSGGIPILAAEIEKQHPKQPEFYIALGDAWRDSHNAAKAAEQYEQALKVDPDSLVALKRLSIALEDSRQFGRLAEVLDRARRVAPNDPAVWFQLGSFDSDQGRNAQAVTELEKAVSLNPDMAEAYQNLAVALAEMGQADRAEAAFRDALRIRPYDARTYSNLARLLAVQKKDIAQAQYCYEKAVALSPEFVAAHYDYAVLLAQSNRLDAAQKQLETAVQYDPQLADAHNLLGGILEMKRQVGPAEREYREALRIRPEFARARLNLGALLAQKGDRAGARENLAMLAQSNDPDIANDARQLLQELGGVQ